VIVVLDASVALKWFVREDDVSTRAADALKQDIVEGRVRAAVPELFLFEVLAVLLRRGLGAGTVAAAVDLLGRLGLRRFPLDAETARRAAELAVERRITGYDASYAALAAALGGRWATFDLAAHARLQPLGISFVPAPPAPA